jgi:hypothetical protein
MGTLSILKKPGVARFRRLLAEQTAVRSAPKASTEQAAGTRFTKLVKRLGEKKT